MCRKDIGLPRVSAGMGLGRVLLFYINIFRIVSNYNERECYCVCRRGVKEARGNRVACAVSQPSPPPLLSLHPPPRSFSRCVQGSARDKEKREKERQQLADLVGKNLTYISQLDGLGYELYASQVRARMRYGVGSCIGIWPPVNTSGGLCAGAPTGWG